MATSCLLIPMGQRNPIFFAISVPGNSPAGCGLFSSPMAHLSAMSREKAIKNTPQLLARYLSGAPCGSKPEHFCVSGRHRHHTAAPPEVMPVVPPREDKRGMLKYQGAFAAYPRFLKLWLRYSTVTLTTIQPHFCPLIAEQPATPYPGGITRAKIGKTKVRTRK